ncbi:hypothetical protein N0M98_31225 [Paenibacillus doosanensis]|uniref:DUF4013 domain-containing protein n=1 Tax=Paenibacillus konkukensis TaxID=2020716 RepID=A0ABY4RSX1_9BACL|nr:MULTISPECIES: hypothetical protein [Paenibacillus]MCS7464571.1 hypothetical protein [Paenibacillus doosanensis]UQZ84844.1 hypothetical protein SK3146_04099 [Paenibacillus konkukensis]
MWKTVKNGWHLTWNQPFVVCTLFIYNLLWGLALYEMIRSIIVPLLHRYPGPELERQAVHMFWIEGQFQLMKTDLIDSYVGWGLCLLIARMLLSPLLNAGVYYSLQHTELNAGYRFVQGMREFALPFFLLYVLQIALQLAPLYWLVPKTVDIYGKHATIYAIAQEVLPLLIAYGVYTFLMQTVFMYLQFGRISGKSSLFALTLLLRNLFPILVLAAALLIVILAVSTAVMASAMIWTGFLALLGYQVYRLIHMFCKLWAISTQYALWSAKSE